MASLSSTEKVVRRGVPPLLVLLVHQLVLMPDRKFVARGKWADRPVAKPLTKRRIATRTSIKDCEKLVLIFLDSFVDVSTHSISPPLLQTRTQDTPEKYLVTAQLHPSAPPFFYLNSPTRQPRKTSPSSAMTSTATAIASNTTEAFASFPFPPAAVTASAAIPSPC